MLEGDITTKVTVQAENNAQYVGVMLSWINVGRMKCDSSFSDLPQLCNVHYTAYIIM